MNLTESGTMLGVYAIGDAIRISISTTPTRAVRSRNTMFSSDRIQVTPTRASALRIQTTGTRAAVQERRPAATVPTSRIVNPTAIVACAASTAFAGTSSIGKTTLLRIALFVTTEVTPWPIASDMAKKGTSPAKM
jgi:hypothetical protein